MRLVLTVSSLAVTLCGCGQAARFGQSAMPAAQARAATASAAPFKSGKADRSLRPISGEASARSPYGQRELTLLGVGDEGLCVSFVDGEPHDRTIQGAARHTAARLDAAETVVMTFEVRESFDELDDNTQWPSPWPQSQVRRAFLIDSVLTPTEGGEWLSTTLGVCGNVPDVTPRSRYLVVTSYPGSGPPTYFVWTLEEAD